MPGQTYDDLVKAPRVALVLGVAAIAMAASACSGDDRPLIETGDVGAATVVEIVEAPATVVAAASASVAAPATGTVQSIRVRDGQQVRKGDVLLVVDSPEAQQRLAQAQQAAAAAPASVTLTEVDAGASNAQASQAAGRAFDRARDAARQIPDRQLRRQALQQVASARAQFVAAQTQANATVTQINQGIASLEQALASLTQTQQAQGQASVAAAQRTVDALVVQAPIRGTVVLGPSAGESGGEDVSGLVEQLPESLAGQAESLLGGTPRAAEARPAS